MRSAAVTSSSSRTDSCPGLPRMFRAAAMVERLSRVVPPPRISVALYVPSSPVLISSVRVCSGPSPRSTAVAGSIRGSVAAHEPGRPEVCRVGGTAAVGGLQHILHRPGRQPGQRPGKQEHQRQRRGTAGHGARAATPAPRDTRCPAPASASVSRPSPPMMAAPSSANTAAETAGPVNGTTSAWVPAAGGDVRRQPSAGQRRAAPRPRGPWRCGRGGPGGPGAEQRARQRPAPAAGLRPGGPAAAPRERSRRKERQPGETAGGVETERLAQDLLPDRSTVEGQRHAGVGQQCPGPVEGGQRKRHKQCGARQQRPPERASPLPQHQAQEDDARRWPAAGATGPRR